MQSVFTFTRSNQSGGPLRGEFGSIVGAFCNPAPATEEQVAEPFQNFLVHQSAGHADRQALIRGTIRKAGPRIRFRGATFPLDLHLLEARDMVGEKLVAFEQILVGEIRNCVSCHDLALSQRGR